MKRIIVGLVLAAAFLSAEYATAQEEVPLTVCINPRGKMYTLTEARPECRINDRVTVWNAAVVLEKPAHLYDNSNDRQDLGILLDTALIHNPYNYAGFEFLNKYKTYLPELQAFVIFGYEDNEDVINKPIKAGEKAAILFTGPSCDGEAFSTFLSAELARTVYRSGNDRYYVSTGEPLAPMQCGSSRDITTGACVECPPDPDNLSARSLPLVQIQLPFNANSIEVPLSPGTPGDPVTP